MKRFRVVTREICQVSYIVEVPNDSPSPHLLEDWTSLVAVAEPSVVLSTSIVEVLESVPITGEAN